MFFKTNDVRLEKKTVMQWGSARENPAIVVDFLVLYISVNLLYKLGAPTQSRFLFFWQCWLFFMWPHRLCIHHHQGCYVTIWACIKDFQNVKWNNFTCKVSLLFTFFFLILIHPLSWNGGRGAWSVRKGKEVVKFKKFSNFLLGDIHFKYRNEFLEGCEKCSCSSKDMFFFF